MTALGEGDQVLATFLKGLELYQAAQLDRAAMQFQNSMQMAPTFAPSRLFLGASLAEGNRHKEAAGLLQSASTTPPNAAIARIAGEEWIKAGQPALAITPLELAVQQPNADRAIEEGAGHRLRARRTRRRCGGGVDVVPRGQSGRRRGAARRDLRHLLAAPQRPAAATLAADRANMAKWSKAYASTKGPMQPLVDGVGEARAGSEVGIRDQGSGIRARGSRRSRISGFSKIRRRKSCLRRLEHRAADVFTLDVHALETA